MEGVYSLNLTSKKEGFMNAIATTRMSSRGQVVIPEEIRTRYGWSSGMSFVVIGHADAIILQPVEMPDMSQFSALLSASREAAQNAGLTPRDIRRAIRSTRQSRKGTTR